ncbi:hypothetical protein [Kitasatospora sp. P5_F3]
MPVRVARAVWLPDGTSHPAYVQYTDTNWTGIAVISGYALLALTTAILAVIRRQSRTVRRGGPTASA